MKMFSILFCLILSACISGKVNIETGVEEIKFGGGGGFTGGIKSFTLTSGGKLFNEKETLKEIGNKRTLEIFRTAQQLKDYSFNNPENMYSFVEIKTKEKTNRIVWAYGSSKIDRKLIGFHDTLMSITK